MYFSLASAQIADGDVEPDAGIAVPAAICATAEAMGQEMNPGTAAIMAEDLCAYPVQVVKAGATQPLEAMPAIPGAELAGVVDAVGEGVTRWREGDAVLVIESMKLEHILCAPRDAVVHSLSASVGQQVGPGQVLVQWKDAA